MKHNRVYNVALIVIVFSIWSHTVFASNPGAGLYQQHCAACHGSDGAGGVGLPLALVDFQSSVSDEYLRKTIRLGRPGRIMPAFEQLTQFEVNAIINFIRSMVSISIPVESTTVINGNVTKGKTLFNQYCASCHGANGEGANGTGVTFSRPRHSPIMPPALKNAGFLNAASDQMIKQTLLKGRSGTPMPSFRELGLSDSNINDLVSYVRSFENSKTRIKTLNKLSPIISYESSYDAAETIASIKRAAIGKNYKIIRTQTIDNGFVSKTQENTRQTVIYFCNFSQLNQALVIDPRVGLFLPCRITVVEQKDKVTVMAINPLRLSKLFNNSQLDKYCIAMKKMYTDIIEEALL